MSSPSAPGPTLARRLTRRAVDLLVIGFVATVGLSIGSQLIEWWRTDPSDLTPDLSSLTSVDLDWNRTPVTLRFGDAATSLERIPFQGDRRRLDEELTRIGQSIVTTTDPPSSPMDEAEKGWLEALQTAPPVFWESTRGNIYRRREPLPSFVATRFSDDSSEHTDESIGQRIVGWGLAFPATPGNWTIYVFHPDSAQKSTRSEPIERLALPDGSRNITDLCGSDGSQWRVIQGRGDLSRWVQHFDQQFGTDAVVARTLSTQTATVKYRHQGIVTDVQIRSEVDGRLTGVVWSAKERERP